MVLTISVGESEHDFLFSAWTVSYGNGTNKLHFVSQICFKCGLWIMIFQIILFFLET